MQINFDAKKLDKALMNDGYVQLDIIPLKEKKVKTKKDGSPIQGDGWRLMKTHFVVQSNKNKDVKMPIIGEGTEFEKVDEVKSLSESDIDISQIPF